MEDDMIGTNWTLGHEIDRATPSLPAMDIAVGASLAAFFEEMEQIGRASGRFDVERRMLGQGATQIDGLNFRLLRDSPHEDLGFQFLAYGEDTGKVEVEVRAQRWRPDPPTRANYIEAARLMVAPLLAAFNRSTGTRLRLRIEAEAVSAFRPTDRTQALLDRFVVCANPSCLHPLDWKRFYAMVLEGRQRIPTGDLRMRLTSEGFTSAAAGKLAEIYDHLWAFKGL